MQLDPKTMNLPTVGTIGAEKNKTSQNARTNGNRIRNTYEINVPNTVKDVRILDKEDINNLWMESVAKEFGALEILKVPKFHLQDEYMDSWYQYAPMHTIFCVKREDLGRKTRLVLGKHVIEELEYESYSSTVQSMSIQILYTIADKNILNVMG